MNKQPSLESKTYAPIILFVYDRPWHTQKTLSALSQNILIEKTTIFVFQDGPKLNDDIVEKHRLNEVEQVILNYSSKLNIKLIQSDINKGLAKSIISGISFVLKQYDKTIVLEDDIVTTKGFLTYMNEALNLYENEDKVMHISAYMFPVKNSESFGDTFFIIQPLVGDGQLGKERGINL